MHVASSDLWQAIPFVAMWHTYKRITLSQNRLLVQVLSVVATQIATLMAAVKIRASRFNFLGTNIRLVLTCGVFVTMNPGYAGRSELPDNLKALVRPVSMMVPDFALIAEIMMFAEGFASARPLSKKMIAIMELSQQQLSKQVSLH
jgi:dynein heavy chain, axonemal